MTRTSRSVRRDRGVRPRRRGTTAVASALLAGLFVLPGAAGARSLEADVARLLEVSCLRCHDVETETPLDLENLGYDLDDRGIFRKWVRVFERLEAGEMPPPGTRRPPKPVVDAALDALARDLETADLAARAAGQTPPRRLTGLEYEYTVEDLLLIEENLARLLPAESASAGFDTLATEQGISPLHLRSYLEAADRALDAAIRLGPRPRSAAHLIDYPSNPASYQMVRQSVSKKLDDAVAMFVDEDHHNTSGSFSARNLRSDSHGFSVVHPGLYRVSVDAYPYQASTPVTLLLVRANPNGDWTLLGAFDLVNGESGTFEVVTFLHPTDYVFPEVADLDWHTEVEGFYAPIEDWSPAAQVVAAGKGLGRRLLNNRVYHPIFYHPTEILVDGAATYEGEGVAVRSLAIEGPLLDAWPPPSTRRLFDGITIDAAGDLQLTKDPYEHVVDVLSHLVPLAFRRPAEAGEVDAFASLARPAIAAGREFVDAVRVPLRAVLSAPQFLYHDDRPGELDDFALATRLSYFLWKSLPDEELFAAAREGRLSEPGVMARQVERMLDDEKARRFIGDFVGQWLRLYEIELTSPDERLYPEYDDLLHHALQEETRLFFTELVKSDLGVRNLIDSDFTFLNRRLAEHYGIPGVEGQHMRKVSLPDDSVRGGVLTQASVLKVTANGTTTSPVFRGSFVLSNLLGRPPNPPPANAGSVEPDIRGATTIREILAQHRRDPTCNVCHRAIDPPGFALEAFDPTGGFRTRYRSSGEGDTPTGTLYGRPILEYKDGPPVDSGGVTPEGSSFSGIAEYKRLLLKEEEDQIARHFISQLVVYATGAEIGFADRDELSRLVARSREGGYGVRAIIHNVTQSPLFRERQR
ncbi:MAG: DUF1592 domain-containing protein [Holophagales bacterium]|nr:DUF1592 domain-containing protein [Holophagales bacterium]MYH26030.1 DUF1592 domain-containing protein [Holophagales bacterium]